MTAFKRVGKSQGPPQAIWLRLNSQETLWI